MRASGWYGGAAARGHLWEGKIEEQEVVVETMYGKLVRAVAMSCEDPELTALLTEAEEAAAAAEEETSEQQRVVDQVD